MIDHRAVPGLEGLAVFRRVEVEPDEVVAQHARVFPDVHVQIIVREDVLGAGQHAFEGAEVEFLFELARRVGLDPGNLPQGGEHEHVHAMAGQVAQMEKFPFDFAVAPAVRKVVPSKGVEVPAGVDVLFGHLHRQRQA